MGKESVRTVKPSDLTNMSENDRTSTQKQQQTRSTKGQNAHKRLSKRTIFTDIHDQLWRGYMWIDGSLVISMLEDWETILLFTVVITLSGLLWYSIIFHLPNHVLLSIEKASYYIFGTSSSRSNDLTKAAADIVQGAGQTARAWAEEL